MIGPNVSRILVTLLLRSLFRSGKLFRRLGED